MEPTDITVQILTDIRDEIRQTNVRLGQTNERLDQTREELGRKIVESEMRTATAITTLAGTLGEVKDLLAARLDLTDRLGKCEQEIGQIKHHIGMES